VLENLFSIVYFYEKLTAKYFKPGKVSKKTIQVSKYQKADCFSFLIEIETSKYSPISILLVENFPEFICLSGAMKRKSTLQRNC